MGRFRVLAVLPGITPDAGAEQSMSMLLPRVVASGIEMHLAVLTDRQTLVPDLERSGVVIHDLSSHRHVPTRARALRKVLGAVRPDVVHATLFEAAVPAQLAVLGTGTAVLVTWAATSYDAASFSEMGRGSWKLRVVQAEEVLLARAARTRFHAVTSGVARVNCRTLQVPTDRVWVGERGRDPERFDVDASDVARVRSTLGISAGGALVVAVGRQDPQKGYSTLLEAFDRVADTHPDAVLAVAGREGRSTPALMEQLERMSHADRVRMLGQRDDVPLLLHAADVVVCSSWREGAAGALIEAMGCGRPIVTVPLDGLEDVVVDGDNGVVVARDDLASGISTLLDNPQSAAELGARGRHVFEHRFTLDRSAARLVEIYREVGAGG